MFLCMQYSSWTAIGEFLNGNDSDAQYFPFMGNGQLPPPNTGKV